MLFLNKPASSVVSVQGSQRRCFERMGIFCFVLRNVYWKHALHPLKFGDNADYVVIGSPAFMYPVLVIFWNIKFAIIRVQQLHKTALQWSCCHGIYIKWPFRLFTHSYNGVSLQTYPMQNSDQWKHTVWIQYCNKIKRPAWRHMFWWSQKICADVL